MKTCTARVNVPDASMKPMDWIRQMFAEREQCGKGARWTDKTTGRPLCDEHAEKLIDASMSDDTVMGMYLAQHGIRPKTRSEARKRYLRPLQ